MYHIILIALLATLSLAVWNLVHASPRSLAMYLPRDFTFFAGTFFLLFGVFFAFVSAHVQHGPAMISFFIKAYVGIWLLLAHLKEDEEIVRTAFMMMGTLLFTMVGIYYVQHPLLVAFITLFGVTAGYWLIAGKPRFLNRGR